MSRVRIVVPGWEHFNGQMIGVPFEMGVSTRELTPNEKIRLGAVLGIADIDTDKQVGAGVEMAKVYGVSAEVVPPSEPEPEAVPEKPLEFDKDKLEEIASEGGIKAVREVAAKFGVKGVEINKMIEDILKAQKEAK